MPFACPLSLSLLSLSISAWFCRFLVSLSLFYCRRKQLNRRAATIGFSEFCQCFLNSRSVNYNRPAIRSLALLSYPLPWPPLCLPPNQLILWILLSVLHVVYVIFDKALFLSSKCFERGALFHIKPKQKRSSKVAGTKRR